MSLREEVKKWVRVEMRKCFVWTCPLCGKEVVALKQTEIEACAVNHFSKHMPKQGGIMPLIPSSATRLKTRNKLIEP